MPTLTCDWYTITCLTHLHAGRGDTNYDIVDKEVQRDPIDGLPIIHASSLKGALREWFNHQDNVQEAVTNTIFGNDSKRKPNQELKQGSHLFFEARLLALPVRSSHQPFFLATSPQLLADCLAQVDLFDITYGPATTLLSDLSALDQTRPLAFVRQAITDDLYLDEYKSVQTVNEPLRQQLQTLLGYEHIALLPHDTLKEVAGRLPVIARNNLENGRSVNLWYEEVVPRQTRFYFFVRHPAAETTLDQTLSAAGGQVQIGANATIGYGQCSLTKLSTN